MYYSILTRDRRWFMLLPSLLPALFPDVPVQLHASSPRCITYFFVIRDLGCEW